MGSGQSRTWVVAQAYGRDISATQCCTQRQDGDEADANVASDYEQD